MKAYRCGNDIVLCHQNSGSAELLKVFRAAMKIGPKIQAQVHDASGTIEIRSSRRVLAVAAPVEVQNQGTVYYAVITGDTEVMVTLMPSITSKRMIRARNVQPGLLEVHWTKTGFSFPVTHDRQQVQRTTTETPGPGRAGTPERLPGRSQGQADRYCSGPSAPEADSDSTP